MENQSPSVGTYINRLIGEDGLQTEVSVTFSNQTLFNLGITVVGSVAVGSFAFFAIRSIFK